MCECIAKENSSKVIALDVHGASKYVRSKKKSMKTNGFNILKVDEDVLYVLNIKITEEEEIHKIYMIKSSAEKLSKLSTTLSGYDSKQLKEIVGKEWPSPVSEADSLDSIILYFASLPGKCDIAVKRVKEKNNFLYIKVYPLIQKKRDANGNEYYPYGKGNFRDVIEAAIKAGEFTEPKSRR